MYNESGFLTRTHYWILEEPSSGEIKYYSLSDIQKKLAQWSLKSGIVISVRSGGIFSFDFTHYPAASMEYPLDNEEGFDKAIRGLQQRVRIVNAFCLGIHVAELITTNIGGLCLDVSQDDIFHFKSTGLGGSGVTSLPFAPGLGFILDHRRFSGVLKSETIKLACEILDTIEGSKNRKLLEIFAMTNSALSLYKKHNFSSSIAEAWTVCESLLRHEWIEHLESISAPGSVISNTQRRRSSAEISQELNQHGKLSDETFDLMNRVRLVRNAWTHSVEMPSRQEAQDCLSLSALLLTQAANTEIRFGLMVGLSH